MPYQVICPSCSAKLKSAQPVPAGRTLACPQCKNKFTLTEPAAEVDTQPVVSRTAPAASGREVPTPRKGSRAEIDDIESADIVDAADFEPSAKGTGRRRRDDEDEDRRSSRRRGEDDDDRPRSRRRRDEGDEVDDRPRRRPARSRDEDEDDRPRRGRRAADDGDDELPKSKRRRDDDEEDLPRSRKGRVVEEDEDDRPRKKSRKGKKGNKALLLAVIGGTAALLFFVGALAFVYFADPFGLFGGGNSEMLAWAPADSQMIVYTDVEGMEKVDEMKGNFKGGMTDSTKFGLKSEDVSAVMGAGKGGGFLGLGDPDVTIIKLRKSVDQKKVIDSAGGNEATASGKKYYKTKTGGGLYFPSEKLLVVTKSESTMTSLLQKDEGKIAISDDLRSATKRGDGLMWIVTSGSAAENGDMIRMMARPGDMFKNIGKGGPGGGASAGPRCKSTLMTVKASGNRATGRFESTYDSPDAAKSIADDLKKVMEQAKNKSADLESFDVSTSGATVTLTLVGPMNKGKAGFPGLPFGGMK